LRDVTHWDRETDVVVVGAGRLSARDLVAIIGAGLRGAGEAVSNDEVAAMTAPHGAAGFVRIASDLLAATFGDGSEGDLR